MHIIRSSMWFQKTLKDTVFTSVITMSKDYFLQLVKIMEESDELRATWESRMSCNLRDIPTAGVGFGCAAAGAVLGGPVGFVAGLVIGSIIGKLQRNDTPSTIAWHKVI